MSDFRCLMSDVWYRVSDIRRLILGIWFQMSDVRCLILDVWCQTSEFRCLMWDVWFHMSVNSVSDWSQCIVNNRKFKMRRPQEIKKSNSLTKEQLCSCITLCCTFVCRHCRTTTWKCVVSCFVKDVNKQWVTKFSFSLWTWVWLIETKL